MKIFISWSGEQSKEIGEAFRNWLPGVLQAVKPYFSPDDIAKGSRWESEIAKELEACRLGLLILTAGNIEAPWLVFEAGALSKAIEKSKVCPLLFGLESADIKGPLVHFQAAKFEAVEIKRVVKMINSEQGEHSLETTVLDEVFSMWWPKLESDVHKILQKPTKAKGAKRTDRDIIEEILSIARQLPPPRGLVERSIAPTAILELLVSFDGLGKMIITSKSTPKVIVELHALYNPIRYIVSRQLSGTLLDEGLKQLIALKYMINQSVRTEKEEDD